MRLVFHGEITLTWSQTSQFHRITEHLSQRHIGSHAEHIALGFSFSDWSLSLHYASHDCRINILTAVYFNIHQGLQNLSSSIGQGFSERVFSGNCKGICAGIDNMSGTVLQDVSDVDDRVTGLWALVHQFHKGLLHSCNVFWRNGCTNNFALEFTFGCAKLISHWLNVPHYSRILASTSWLFLVQIIEVGLLCDCFSIVDTWSSDFDVNTELSFHSFSINLQMQLTHAADYYFLWFFIDANDKSWVFSLEFWDGLLELWGAWWTCGLDGQTHDWLRHVHTLASNNVFHVAWG